VSWRVRLKPLNCSKDVRAGRIPTSGREKTHKKSPACAGL
jgi:hypothetical protein